MIYYFNHQWIVTADYVITDSVVPQLTRTADVILIRKQTTVSLHPYSMIYVFLLHRSGYYFAIRRLLSESNLRYN